MAVYDTMNILASRINCCVYVPLEEYFGIPLFCRLAVRAKLNNVVQLNEPRRLSPCQEVAIGSRRMPRTDMPKTIQHLVAHQNSICQYERGLDLGYRCSRHFSSRPRVHAGPTSRRNSTINADIVAATAVRPPDETNPNKSL